MGRYGLIEDVCLLLSVLLECLFFGKSIGLIESSGMSAFFNLPC